MSDEEFAELVAEVRHLGRLPKPVVVRRKGDGWEIVDGEHSWRAAQETGLTDVPCEVIDADDFESMRQTYKRNQHGTHDSVRLGRMFRQMTEARGLSQRALAKEINVSEGTVRNAMVYAEAAHLRNGYARASEPEAQGAEAREIAELSVREARAYVALPAHVRDIWLDSGAELKSLWQATQVTVKDLEGKQQRYDLSDTTDRDSWAELVEVGLAVGLRPEAFVASARRAFQMLFWRLDIADVVPGVDAYIQPVAELGLDVEWLDYIPSRVIDGDVQFILTPERWVALLRGGVDRSDDPTEQKAIILASLRTELRKAGIALEDVTDPRIAEVMTIVRGAPDFIEQADLSLEEKYQLARKSQDADAFVLQAIRNACKILEYRDRVLAGQEVDFSELTHIEVGRLAGNHITCTAEDAFQQALEQLEREHQRAVFDNRDQLVEAVVNRLKKEHALMRDQVGGRVVAEVLTERLSVVPLPELRLLAAYVLEAPPPEGRPRPEEVAGLGLWREAVRQIEEGARQGSG